MRKRERWPDSLPRRMFEGSLREDQDRLWEWLERRRREREGVVRFELGIPVTPLQGEILDGARRAPQRLDVLRALHGKAGEMAVRQLEEAGLLRVAAGFAWAT